MRLCVDAEAVEQADIALVGGHRDVALLGGRDGREVVLAHVLLELGVDELAAREAGVDAVEGVAADAEEGRLMRHLGEFVLWRKGDNGDVLMDSPLVDHLAVLEVHAIQLVRVRVLLQDEVAVLVVQHDLLGREELALGGLDFGDVGAELEVVVGRVLEDANLGAANDE